MQQNFPHGRFFLPPSDVPSFQLSFELSAFPQLMTLRPLTPLTNDLRDCKLQRVTNNHPKKEKTQGIDTYQTFVEKKHAKQLVS